MERQKKERVPLPIPPFCATRVLTTYAWPTLPQLLQTQTTASHAFGTLMSVQGMQLAGPGIP